MNLLVVLNGLGIGGAENYTIGLINQFIENGHQVKLIVLSNELSLKARLAVKVELLVLPRKLKFDIKVLLKLRKEIKSKKVDAIISSYVIYQKLSMICSYARIPVIYPIHSTIPRNIKEYLFNKLVFNLRGKGDVFLTSIEGQTEYLIKKYKLSKNFFEQILNGIDTNYFSICPYYFNKDDFLKILGVPTGNKVILMVAGFREEKRHLDAIMAFQLLKTTHHNVSLICVGNNNLVSKQYLESIVQCNNIKDVILLSAAEAGEVKNYYWACDLFTLTSDRVETFSISALEALSCGKPCVITNIGGATDFISNMKNGYLVNARDIESIRDGWHIVLENLNLFNSVKLHEYIDANYSIKTSASNYIDMIKRKKYESCNFGRWVWHTTQRRDFQYTKTNG